MTLSVSATDVLSQQPPPASASVELSITGMTCAACVRRIEKAVRAVPGVNEASVNLVTQRASVKLDPSATKRALLVAAIEKAGYGVVDAPSTTAITGAPSESRADALASAEAREQQSIRRDFAIAAILTLPLLVIGMSHGAIPGTAGPA
ncbi:MAG: cation transporter [Myxococcota bacterium]|nr:cation transporter [Myxococcota bacterium]